MIVNLIVLGALLILGIYTVCWLCSANMRRKIEQPKHNFQKQLEQFDSRYNAPDKKVEKVE